VILGLDLLNGFGGRSVSRPAHERSSSETG
jgi:hypothetical protein